MKLPASLLVSLLAMIPAASLAEDPLPNLPDWVFAVAPEDENLNVLHFGDVRPTLIQFRVRINGQGFRSSWESCVARLHKYVDADEDGILTELEMSRTGWRRLVAFAGGDFSALSGPYPVDSSSIYGAKAGRISVDEFRDYVRNHFALGPIEIQAAHSANPIDQAVFNQYDRNRDGSLSSDELASNSADTILRQLDADEDELVDRQEFQPNRNPLADYFSQETSSVQGDALKGPLVALASPAASAQAARRLLSRYDGADASAKDGRLSARESGFAPSTFQGADGDGDGRLDLAELERFLEAPIPEIVLVLRLSKNPGQPLTIEANSSATPDPRLEARPDRDWVISFDGRKVQITPNDGVNDFRGNYDQRFATSDLDKDGSLDRSEATKGFFFARIFDAVDRNADDRLSKAELTLYFATLFDLRLCRATIQVSEDGRPIFEPLDADNDGRLGRRELREASKRLNSFDANGDGRLRLDEIPLTVRVRIGRGPSNSSRGSVNFDSYDSDAPSRPAVGKSPVAWFRKMDRNRDGDVSPAEFLGSLADFRKLDADGDGLIDEREAAKGP